VNQRGYLKVSRGVLEDQIIIIVLNYPVKEIHFFQKKYKIDISVKYRLQNLLRSQIYRLFLYITDMSIIYFFRKKRISFTGYFRTLMKIWCSNTPLLTSTTPPLHLYSESFYLVESGTTSDQWLQGTITFCWTKSKHLSSILKSHQKWPYLQFSVCIFAVMLAVIKLPIFL